jgi:GTP-binding protein HflX
MGETFDTSQLQEKVVLVAIETSNNEGMVEAYLDELEELAQTAGAITVGRMVQKREGIHSGHYLGKGKIEELAALVEQLGATGIICDDELSPAQLKNLNTMLDTKVMDRTMLILDIFAARAQSREGKIQVELAQLKYRMSRLAGLGVSMSRLGGGIGTRGPGEKKLEMDRRYLRERAAELNNELKNIETNRQTLRNQRQKNSVPVISIVGYTNAGKSTLLNTLTDAGVLSEDKLFATLDTTTRRVNLPGDSEVLMTDTVGFIRKLPHHLVKAFRSTLEEVKQGDILLHVVDVSNERCEDQIKVVYETIKDLGCLETPVITVFNKIDKDSAKLPYPIDTIARKTVNISAKTGEGIDRLLSEIEELLQSSRNKLKVLIPYSDGYLLNMLHGQCEIISEEHTGEGVLVESYMNEEMTLRLSKYTVD